jgi:hypothetical protein|tara:strand:- start:1244 stop:1624 length:381 start_codon:yes stop_codon:yes gene_type:complete
MPSKMMITAMIFGIAAVLLGVFHGYFETQQGSVAPSSIFINAIGGTDCEPSCFPAMTIIPNFLVAGIVTILVGTVMFGWVIFRLKDKKGGIGLIILSLIFLLTGGGYLAPTLSTIGGVLGIFIKKE